MREYDEDDRHIDRAHQILSGVLFTKKQGSHIVTHQLALNVVLNVLLNMTKDLPQLRRIILEAIVLNKHIIDPRFRQATPCSFAELVFTHDNRLWKLFRKTVMTGSRESSQ